MRLLPSSGTLRYSLKPYKLIVQVDEDLVRFYRRLIPKYFECHRQKYAPHITVLRRQEALPNMTYWEKYENSPIDFEYDPCIQADTQYWWLNVDCPQLTKLRQELGLEPWDELNKPPSGIEWFHITLGNRKQT